MRKISERPFEKVVCTVSFSKWAIKEYTKVEGARPEQGKVYAVKEFFRNNDGVIRFTIVGTKLVHKKIGQEIRAGLGSIFRILPEKKCRPFDNK